MVLGNFYRCKYLLNVACLAINITNICWTVKTPTLMEIQRERMHMLDEQIQ